MGLLVSDAFEPATAVPAPGPAGGIVGRHRERTLLDRALDEVRAGTPRAVGIEGPAGIGKTALLNSFLADAADCRVLSARGDESETVLELGLVGQLLRAVEVGIPAPLVPVAHGRSTALDHVTAGAALLEVLGEVEQREPVVLVVEDLHWADVTSLQAIAFAWRRLRTDRILLVTSVRPEGWSRLPTGLARLLDEAPGGIRVALGGLDVTGVADLGTRHGRSLSVAAARRLHEYTAGNPLFVKALVAELDPASLEVPTGQPVPAPRSYSEIIVARLGRCTEPARDLVEAAAVLGIYARLDEVQALSPPTAHAPAALDEAAAAGLLTCHSSSRGLELSFAHPLIRAAVYHALPLARRCELHRRAAALVGDELVKLQHEVAARHGPDDALAARLEEFAHHQIGLSHAAWFPSAAALLGAARVSGDTAERDRRVLSAVDHLLTGGDGPGALALAGDLTAYPATPQRDYVMARIRMGGGDATEAERLLDRAWSRAAEATGAAVDGDGPARAGTGAELAGMIAGWRAVLLATSGRAQEAVEWSLRAIGCAPTANAVRAVAASILPIALASQGQAAQALELVAGLPDSPAEVAYEQCTMLGGRGLARLWSDDVAAARNDLARATELARAHGASGLGVGFILCCLADAEWRLGHWEAAVSSGERAVTLTGERGPGGMHGTALAIAALPHIGRGNLAEAEAHIEAGERVGAAGGDLISACYVAGARARLELARQRPTEALRAIGAVMELGREPLREICIQPWRLIHAEALLDSGDLDAAGSVLDEARDWVRERGVRSPRVVLARLYGQLAARRGRLAEARTIFEDGLADTGPETGSEPFELARLELAAGLLLRRTGRQRDAKPRLEAARDRFLRLGAVPSLRVCETALGGAGLGAVYQTDDGRQLLTSAELAVARRAARGMTNREVAADLVLSRRTVENHLASVYTKLGINSRRQLGEHLPGDD